MRSESLSSRINLRGILEGNVASLSAVKSFRQANEIGRQLVWIRRQSGTQPLSPISMQIAPLSTRSI
jgi:hypothetical protein